ncbi:hypothetical protein BCV72DRAFT_255861 [Rhizopus microsporus var. microsporus]|uniref:Uncharacterized protein n=1 Tax=Rhizopus microsporus var. microsporus TaxID=86635 RepID=A0A1X0R5Y4_RHIZD|nr:hypothetical protein BCV72DRAFT_255861 [Rhizopus microsporus var. microsporus]
MDSLTSKYTTSRNSHMSYNSLRKGVIFAVFLHCHYCHKPGHSKLSCLPAPSTASL